MKKITLLLAAASLLLTACRQETRQERLTGYVNPFIGTAYTGHTHPCATTPFGMVQVGPDTGISGWEHCSGYHDADSVIYGFSHTHLSGTGCGDMGDIMILPVSGEVSFDEESYKASFSHDTEASSPGYYKVRLSDYDVLAEMTATPRCGFHRYTFSGTPELLFDMGHGISDQATESYLRLIDERTLVGMRRSSGFIEDHRFYFCARFSLPVSEVSAFQDGEISDNKDVKGIITKTILRFSSSEAEPLLVKVGLSTASEEGAINNLDAEIPGWSFDETLASTEKTWNEKLGRIRVETISEGEKTAFYTSLYHSLLMPNLVSDIDGSYMGWDRKVHKDPIERFTNFSLWDTYRAEHPFLGLVYPESNNGFVKSLVERFSQTGLLVTNEYGSNETWCMIGNHAVPVIADAILKGTTDVDPDAAYEAVKASLTTPHNKSDWSVYDKHGYFPMDIVTNESVSRTLEDCYDDWCAAKLAGALGKKEDEAFFLERADYYKNLFDSSTGLMRAKDSEGKWRVPFDPVSLAHDGLVGGDYTEGNAWQYTWHVQHDVEGLIALEGGSESFRSKLDTLFTVEHELKNNDVVPDVTGLIGQYAHGNEPSHHVAYLFTLAGDPDRTAELVREVCDKFYLPERDGLCGNDDCGQMSAWYMFSVLGFYPVDPVSGEYVIGAPLFPRMEIDLPGGTLVMTARNLSEDNKYVDTVTINGKPVTTGKLSYQDIKNGGTLEFVMRDKR